MSYVVKNYYNDSGDFTYICFDDEDFIFGTDDIWRATFFATIEAAADILERNGVEVDSSDSYFIEREESPLLDELIHL